MDFDEFLTEDDMMRLVCFAELFTRMAHAPENDELFAHGDLNEAISTVARIAPQLWPRHVRTLAALVDSLREKEQFHQDETVGHTIQ